MCKFIGIEDLAANALIELIEKHDCKFVGFNQILRYGTVIIRILREKNLEAVLLVSRDYTTDMMHNYSDFFEVIVDKSGEDGIALKDGKSIDDLRDNFRALLNLDMLRAFTDNTSLKELGVTA